MTQPISLLDIHPRGMKTDDHPKTGARMFTAAPILTDKRWTHPKRPSMRKKIKRAYIHTMKYNVAITKE